MQESELIIACVKNDKVAKKQLFDMFYGKFAFIALRYCKNNSQADVLSQQAFSDVFHRLNEFKHQTSSLEDFCRTVFISSLVKQVKSIRNEYYVASTVRAVERTDKSYDLFLDRGYIDFRTIDKDVILKSIQELVPSQRLVFNMQIIDNFDLAKTSELLDTNEQTIKSNLEKARFNLQKGIEKNLKHSNNEQPV